MSAAAAGNADPADPGPSRSELVISARDYDDPDVTRMIAAAQRYYTELYGTPDESEISAEEFVAPLGRLLVATLDGHPVATGAWRTFAPDVAEIKRMYVEPSARRRGVAWRMLRELERDAARAGVRRMVLVTGVPQAAAVALYRAAGYSDADHFGRYADSDSAVFLARDLAGGDR